MQIHLLIQKDGGIDPVKSWQPAKGKVPHSTPKRER